MLFGKNKGFVCLSEHTLPTTSFSDDDDKFSPGFSLGSTEPNADTSSAQIKYQF